MSKIANIKVFFTRIGTKEERISDSRNDRGIFKILYEELEKRILKISLT